MEPMGEVRFRQGNPDDASDVLGIKQVAIESTRGVYDDRQVEAWKPTETALSAFEQAMEDEQFVVLLVEAGDDPAGYGVLNADAGRIDAVFVEPAYTGLGLGSSLVGQLETRAQMLGLSELTVVSSLNARPFYASLGFEPFEQRTRTIDGVDLEFVAMRKTLEG